MPEDVSVTTTPTPNGTNTAQGISEAESPSQKKAEENRKEGAADTAQNEVAAKILEDARKRQDELLTALSKPPRFEEGWWKVWRWRRRDPELLSVYGVIYSHLGEIQRLMLMRMTDPLPGLGFVEKQLQKILDQHRVQVRTFDVHAAWEFAASLERVLLLLGDKNYIVTRLEGEQEKVNTKQPGSWVYYLGVEKLTALLAAYKKGATHELRLQAVEHLAFLYWSRSCYLRTQRAREELKADYLNRLTFVLTILLLLLLEAICISVNGDYWNRSSPRFSDVVNLRFQLDLHHELIREAIVAAMTGAIGSTLSGFYKLRDEAGGIAMLRSFRSAMWAQPFVGATVGMLLMLFIVSGILTFATGGPPAGTSVTTNWIILGIYCFIAGFSEPFFLGVVARVAGAADKKTAGDVGAGSRPNNKPT